MSSMEETGMQDSLLKEIFDLGVKKIQKFSMIDITMKYYLVLLNKLFILNFL